MKRQDLQDERVVAQHRKINSEAYGVLITMLIASMFIQQFLLNAPPKQFAGEFICFFGASAYMLVRHTHLGLNLFGEGKRARAMPLISCVISGATVTVLSGSLSYTRYIEHYKGNMGFFIMSLLITFFSAAAFVFIPMSCLIYLNDKKQAKIRQRLDRDEQDE